MLIYPNNADLERLNFDNTTLQETAHPVNITDYDKRIDALLYQLPELVIATIELCGIRTPGLKPVSTDWVKNRNGVWTHGDDVWIKLGNGQWVVRKDEYYQTLTKFDDLEKWKKGAYELVEKQREERKESDLLWFIPYRGQFQEKDIERTYNAHYDRIFRALVNSTKQEETVLKMESLRDRAYDVLTSNKYDSKDVGGVLHMVFKTYSEEIYDLLKNENDEEGVLSRIIDVSANKLNTINKAYT